MTAPNERHLERPLSATQKAALIVMAAGTIALFYIFAALTGLVLLLLITMELVVAIALARFGMTRLVTGLIERHSRLLALLGKSFWLRQGVNYRMRLEPAQAPGLFATMNKLALQLKINPPDAIYLEMNAGAWVELKGLRRNFGTTNVGIGYDLLAALNAAEVEAVLAHELVHAKLVWRVFKRWLRGGLSRAGSLSHQLTAVVANYRRANKSFETAQLVLSVADRLTRGCARLVATYSRQDEFDADRGAAELCGAAPLRSALMKLEALEGKIARLPWNERVAQLQSPEGFSRWLVAELNSDGVSVEPDNVNRAFNAYATHPALADRLAALPDSPAGSSDKNQPAPPSAPALGLLDDPDDVANKMMAHIQQTLAAEEAKDRKNLRGVLRQIRAQGGHTFTAWQLPSVLVCFFGGVAGLFTMVADHLAIGAVVIAGSFILGRWLYVLGRRRDRRELSIPDYPSLISSWTGKKEIKDLDALQKQMDGELRGQIAGLKGKRQKLDHMAGEAYGALARCDYLRAHVASRLCLELKKSDPEGSLALAIASAAFNQQQQCGAHLGMVLKATRLRTKSTRWGAAWAYILAGAWGPAEALLHELLVERPDEPTFLALLALCQSQRHKFQSALESARRACATSACSDDHVKLLLGLLLHTGHLNEAEQWLQKIAKLPTDDRELKFLALRLQLLRHQYAKAESTAETLNGGDAPGQTLVELGQLFENARRDEKAAGFYNEALETGHFPAAQLGLSRLAAQAGNKELARSRAYAALNTAKPVGNGATSPTDLFPNVLGHLMQLEEPAANCRAWIAIMPGLEAAGPLAGRSLMILAPEQKQADDYAQKVLAALQPDKTLPEGFIYLKLAPDEHQPAMPVRPGVQHVYG